MAAPAKVELEPLRVHTSAGTQPGDHRFLECFFWATYSGAELDLFVVRGRQRIGVEIKRTTAPAVTRSMHVAAEDLRLDRLYVVHAGAQSFDLAPGIRAIAFARLLDDLPRLR